MLPDMPHLGVDPIVVVKGMRRAIRRVRPSALSLNAPPSLNTPRPRRGLRRGS
jgi:hypothetical protein